MIVRTYSRRSRPIGRCLSDPSLIDGDEDDEEEDLRDPFSLSQPLESSQEHGLLFSSQDSSHWAFYPEVPALPTQPKERELDRGSCSGAKNPMATLMEAQEFGEMMEHVDEVNFALDGLRRGKPLAIRRSSLLSLLSVCGSAQQRRLLRAQGMVKSIINAILGLNLDDCSISIAAATLFYLLSSDGQDDNLLDSPCILFLLKLLNPPVVGTVENKAPTFGSKLISLRKPPMPSSKDHGLDCSSAAIISKVREILLNSKEVNSSCKNIDGDRIPELSSKWIALLTIEKACFSVVSFEDASDAVRKVNGTFKERLREHGGLDAVFDIIVSCYYKMERWSKDSTLPDLKAKNGDALQSTVLLLKCLKVVENATFLSEDNQKHLLWMKVNSKYGEPPLSFVGVIIKSIEFLSGLSLLQSSSSFSKFGSSVSKKVDPHSSCQSTNVNRFKEGSHASTSLIDNGGCCGIDEATIEAREPCKKHQRLSVSQSKASSSCSEMATTPLDEFCFRENRVDCSASISCNKEILVLDGNSNGFERRVRKGTNGWISIKSHGSKMKLDGFSIGSKKSVGMRDCENNDYDPFAFDGDDTAPSKWELLDKKKVTSQVSEKNKMNKPNTNFEHSSTLTTDRSDDQIQECNQGNSEFANSIHPSFVDNGNASTTCLDDCLLTAIKVLMNLTNDNPVGCRQIGCCGGLEILASLIVSHFPSFDIGFSNRCQVTESIPLSKSSSQMELQSSDQLSDHVLDLLVAILGLLVNLVEKDSKNRSCLASSRVSLHQSGISTGKGNHIDVIPLLCCIFLANQGAGKASDDGKDVLCDDEASLLQGQKEAEMMIIEAYAALLLAFLSTESTKARESIASLLPNHNLQVLVPVLERFVAFHLSLNMISPETHSVVTQVIESCKGS